MSDQPAYFTLKSSADEAASAPPDTLALPTQTADTIAELMAALSPRTHVPNTQSALLPPTAQFITQDPLTMLTLNKAYKIRALPDQNDPVLILGPSGTGKELLARVMHKSQDQPFISVNISAVTETLLHSTLFGHNKGSFTGAVTDFPGVFRAAKAGTVFLDEIGDMPLAQQSALLRVIQERVVTPLGTTAEFPISCRIVAATNVNVRDRERFRHDLLGRFMYTLRLRPLSERPCDIEAIATHFGLTADDLALIPAEDLAEFNVRALQHAAAEKRLMT